MGKIRVKSFEETSAEDEAKLKAKKEAKKAEKIAAKNAERAAAGKKINPQTEQKEAPVEQTTVTTAEEIVTTPEESITTTDEVVVETVMPSASPVKSEQEKPAAKEKAKKEKFVKVSSIGTRHKSNLTQVSKTANYTLDQALEALRKFKKANFDESVELHINTKEKGISGQIVLPHGTGKTLVIKVADETILSEVAKGKINFDVLVATPSMMPQLARVAKILGPRGLMPNPKNGTITDNPDEAIKKLSGGQVSYKTESQIPIIHAAVGKVSFDDAKLKENIQTFLTSVGTTNIKSATLKSTMSPGIKLALA